MRNSPIYFKSLNSFSGLKEIEQQISEAELEKDYPNHGPDEAE